MNKEEHLGRETAAFLKPRGSIGQGEATLLLRLSDVLAERDAAREELAQARNRIEFLENGAAPVDAAQPAEDVAPKLREALALSLGVDPSRPIWALVNEAIGRIRFLEVAAQPESAPVVGGVTELMLDEIQHLVDQYPYCPGVDEKASTWLTSARAAIRAQKRVDVETLREIAAGIGRHRTRGRAILRAIGDEPAEAPVAEPQTKTCTIEPTAEQLAQLRELRPYRRPEPAAPAQEGPYDARGLNLWENGKVIAWCNAFADLNKLVRLLNLGVEAEKLRARVAELGKSIGEMYERCRENSEAWAVLTGRNWWQTRDEGSLLLAAKDVKARADAAENRVAELEYEQQRVSKAVAGGLRDETMMVGSLVWDVVGLKARADAAQADMKALREALDATRNALGISAFSAPEMMAYHASAVVARADAAEAKLATLGENPIRRGLVMRHLDASEYESVDLTLNAILAGREPGVAS